MNKKLQDEKDKALKHEQTTYERNMAYKDSLQNQLQDVENRKLLEYEQFLREKAMVDDIVRRIMEEDAR
jgi:hypothetical protein